MRPKLQKKCGKSLLPAVIDYGAWRKGDTYVFNHRFELAPGSQPEASPKDFARASQAATSSSHYLMLLKNP